MARRPRLSNFYALPPEEQEALLSGAIADATTAAMATGAIRPRRDRSGAVPLPNPNLLDLLYGGAIPDLRPQTPVAEAAINTQEVPLDTIDNIYETAELIEANTEKIVLETGSPSTRSIDTRIALGIAIALAVCVISYLYYLCAGHFGA